MCCSNRALIKLTQQTTYSSWTCTDTSMQTTHVLWHSHRVGVFVARQVSNFRECCFFRFSIRLQPDFYIMAQRWGMCILWVCYENYLFTYLLFTIFSSETFWQVSQSLLLLPDLFSHFSSVLSMARCLFISSSLKVIFVNYFMAHVVFTQILSLHVLQVSLRHSSCWFSSCCGSGRSCTDFSGDPVAATAIAPAVH